MHSDVSLLIGMTVGSGVFSITTSVGSGVVDGAGMLVEADVGTMLIDELSVGFAVTTGPIPVPPEAIVAAPVADPVAMRVVSGGLISSFWPIWRILDSGSMWLSSRICCTVTL